MSELIRAVEAAELLGVNRSTLTRWVAAGHITPAVKAPGYKGILLFDRADIEAHKDGALA